MGVGRIGINTLSRGRVPVSARWPHDKDQRTTHDGRNADALAGAIHGSQRPPQVLPAMNPEAKRGHHRSPGPPACQGLEACAVGAPREFPAGASDYIRPALIAEESTRAVKLVHALAKLNKFDVGHYTSPPT